ncbi:MAG: NHLP bacteriocin export ABC transporter permease/ATPase subunit [Anaerolineae bacterium]|nr:NHLP bacteriocin export ABC transporter permease/ATPase subunit [Anaerolineae bacterium]
MTKTQTPSERWPLELCAESGRLLHTDRRRPILLDDRRMVWIVCVGWVDVFAASARGEGRRHHLFRVEAGQALFGMDCDDCEVVLLAVGGPDTQLVQVSRSRLQALGRQSAEEVVALIDRWVSQLSTAVARQLPPKESRQLAPVEALSLEDGQTVRAERNVLWVRPLEGRLQWMGVPALPLASDGFYPLLSPTWLQSIGGGRLCAVDTETFIRQDPTWAGLDRFHRLVLDGIALKAAQAEQAEQEHLRARAEAKQWAVEGALDRLTAVLRAEPSLPFVGAEEGRVDPLLAACHLVGQALGLKVRPSPNARGDPLKNIAMASMFRVRQVALRGEWWRTDNGPLLAYQDGQPVALLPISPRSYELVNPLAQTRTPVTAQVAASLAPLAHVFYRPFPDRPLTVPDLIRFGFQGARGDLLMVALMGTAAGVLGLVVPLVTGVLFDSVIPGAERGQLWQVGLALFVGILAASLFQIVQNIAVLRLEGRWDRSILAAVWDRLLRLPVSFFRRYSSGDLAERAMGIDLIRRTLSGTVISSFLASLFALFSFGLLFYYDVSLAWVATGLVLVSTVVTVASGLLQMRHQRTLTDLQGRISGMILQFVTGIAKLRTAGAEGRAFALWARAFSTQKKATFEARSVANSLTVFNAVYPVLTSMAIFAMVALSKDRAGLSTGDFLAFITAFGQFTAASLAASSALISTLNIVPIYERARPILQTLPEADLAKFDPGDLSGEIEVSHVVFRYREDEPLVLRDVSLHVGAGKFVAIVGPSGCGKSTLIRLLLGFETPLAGAIYYDGQDLAGLDVEKVRHQLGVVLQNDRLSAGDIFTNIVGSLPLTIEDAWEAARMVGLDEDIAQMPMGMHTVISEGGGTLSGGQRQRLLIARAIVNKPRILFFDEATSALDNQAQAIVSESLERLQATRFVVAHRLSTIVNADRIFVLDGGRIVQSGTYEELMGQEGLFAELARRQLM